MNKLFTVLCVSSLVLTFTCFQTTPAQSIFTEDFESGTASLQWERFFAGEDIVAAVPMANAPTPLSTGGSYVGWLQDVDTSYTGIALSIAGTTEMKDYSIEADVYCYVNHPDGSAYTGLVIYADSSIGTYIKMTADFDAVPYPRIRLFNNRFNFSTFTYSFDYSYKADSIPGGIPTENGWHKMKVEVKTLNADSTAFWCYFDGQLLGTVPAIDNGDDRMSSGKYGVYVFQNGFPLPGYFDNIVVNSLVTSLDDNSAAGLPDGFYLEQNFPNPFNPETNIAYQLSSSGYVTLSVYDLLGQKIKTLVSKDQSAGSYNVNWNGTDESGNSVPTGIYLYTLSTGNFKSSKKMILLK